MRVIISDNELRPIAAYSIILGISYGSVDEQVTNRLYPMHSDQCLDLGFRVVMEMNDESDTGGQ
jgi:hypothetical protein